MTAQHFLDLHVPGKPLLMPNPWDVGTARQLETLGYQALATTSSGHAGTLGLLDGGVGQREAIAHAAAIVTATQVPVSADLENGFGDAPEAVAETVRLAAAAGLAGCSIEDRPTGGNPYDPAFAAARVKAAANVARKGANRIALTARAENHIAGNPDLADTIERLQAFQEAGADVLFAPGLTEISDIELVVRSVDRPVSVLLRPGMTVAALAAVGVARISVGGAFHLVALAAVDAAARELIETGTTSFWDLAKAGVEVRARAFRSH